MKQSEKEAAARAQIKAEYQAFLEGDGKLPRGFTQPYLEPELLEHGIRYGTPFRAYLDEIGNRVARLDDKSGISDWLCFDGSREIDQAAAELVRWCNLHRRFRLEHSPIPFSMHRYATQKVMVVMADIRCFDSMEAETKLACREANISFCTILSENSLYDLTEETEKKIDYVTYPNYHDETYANWWLG